MGATLSAQQDSKCEEDEEQYPGQDEALEDSEEDKLLQNNGQFSSQSEKTENLTDEMNSQSEGRDLLDVGSGFVTLKEDHSDTTNSSQEDVSQSSTNNISKQMNNTDDMIAKEENEANNKQNDTEIGFKKIFRFGGLKFTLKKDKVEKIDADEPIKIEEDINATSPSEDSWDTIDVNVASKTEQNTEVIMNERMGSDTHAESPKTYNKSAIGKISSHIEHQEEASPDKKTMEDVPKSPEPEELMSPIKRFFSQGLLSSLKKKKKEGEKPKENEEELKSLDKIVEKETTKDDTTCTCLDVSSSIFDQDKDIQLYKKDECKPTAERDIMDSVEQDKVQASPFKRLFRKLSTRRQSDTKPVDINLPDPGKNSNDNPKLSTEFIKSEKEQETTVVVTQPSGEMVDMSHEESKKKSDSTVSWENLICVRSGKARARKSSDSENETQDKGEVLKRTTESPIESSTEADHLTSSNEQGGSPEEEDSGSTWKSFKKLVTPKRKSRMEESGSVEQIQSDTEIAKDESSCSLRKLISGRKKIKPDGQLETMSSDEGSKETEIIIIEDDEMPGVVPLSEYEIVEPENLNVITDGQIESKKDKEMQPAKEEDKPKQIQILYNDGVMSGVPIPTECMEELTEFLSKHQQLSDIPEEGIIEESVATPLSFVEWITQDDTIDDDIVDMTADAVTAPEPASECNEEESTEMVSAVSQLSESPKTSGNVTPVSPVNDMRESDMEFMESISMVPVVLSITTKDKVPEALAVSVSQFILESTTTTETKVLVTHKKDEATSICIGIVSQEIRATEVVLPLPIVEGISEITHAVPTEIVSVDLVEESEAAGTATDNVYKAEIKEIRTMLHEPLLHAEESVVLSETASKSNQTVIMVKNIEEEVFPVIQMEDVVDDSTEFFNGIHGFAPVHSAVQGGSQLLEEQIIALNINRPETEGPLQSALEEPVYKYLTENTKTPVEAEKEHRFPDVESSTVDVQQLTVATIVTHNVDSVPDSSLNGASKIIEDIVQDTELAKPVMYSVVASTSNTDMYQASEIIEMTKVLVSDVKCVETTMPISEVTPMSDSIKTETELKNEVQKKIDSPLQNAETELALGTTLDSADALEHRGKIGDEEKQTETAKPEVNFEVLTKKETLEIVKPFLELRQLDTDQPQTESFKTYEENNQAASLKMAETTSEVGIKHDEETGVDFNISDQPTTPLQCLKQIDSVNSLEEVKKTDKLSVEKQTDNTTAKPNITKGIITEQQEAVEKFLEVELQFNAEQTQKEVLSLKPGESQATESSHEPYKENQVTSSAEITATISSVKYEGTEEECKVYDQKVESGLSFKDVDAVLVNTKENVTEIPLKDESQDDFVQYESQGSEHVIEVVKTAYHVSVGVGEHEVELTVGSEQDIVSPDVAEQEVISEIGIANATVVEKDTELIAASNLKDETTMNLSEAQAGVTSETVVESPLVTANDPESEMLIPSEILEVRESKADIILISETPVEICVVDSLVYELEVKTQVVTSTERNSTQSLSLTSEINNFQSDLKSLNTPDVSTATTLRESPIVSEIQTEESLASLTAAPSPVLKEVAEKGDIHINRPVTLEVTEPKLEMLMVTEAISHTSAVSALEEQTIKTSAIETESLVRRLKVEKNVNMQGLVVTSIKQTGLETPDAVDINALKLPMAEETSVGTPDVTEQIIRVPVLTSVMENMESTVFSSTDEVPKVVSCMKQATASVTAGVQTPTMVLKEVQILTVLPVVETQAVNSAENQVDLSVAKTEVNERYCDAHDEVAVNVDIRQPLHTESEFKVTEITKQVIQDIQNTANPKEDSKSPEERSGKLHEVSLATVETAESSPEPDEDVWEDAFDDISDYQSSSTKTRGGLQDTV